MKTMLFRDRADGGRQLAARLMRYAGRADVIVLGLPRGGVAVAYEVADLLGVALDVAVVRKLGVPGHGELAVGAIAWDGTRVLNNDVVRDIGISNAAIDDVTSQETRELQRRDRLYRKGRPPIDVAGKTVIVVDDGLATGATMRAAVTAVKGGRPARVVVAVPVGAAATCETMSRLVDEVVCLYSPHSFAAVGLWYEQFEQTSDGDVCALLGRLTAQRM